MSCLVVDSSVLVTLSSVGVLSKLRCLFSPVLVPEVVQLGVVDRGSGWREALEAQDEIRKGDWLITRSCVNGMVVDKLRNRLDLGESEVIALAMETGCSAAIDERKGRRIAVESGLQPVGSVGLILSMKKVGLISLVKPYLDSMLDGDFRCSPEIVNEILGAANE